MVYAQIYNNVVMAISDVPGEIIANNMIDITNFIKKPKLGDMYDSKTNSFVAPEPEEKPETIEQKIERLERKLQEDSIIHLEVMATIFEELITMKE